MPKFWISETAGFNGEFPFSGRGKTNFLGGCITSKLASQWPSTSWLLGHIKACCPTRFLAQKTFVILKKRILKKRWPNKKLFLARPACIYRQFLYHFGNKYLDLLYTGHCDPVAYCSYKLAAPRKYLFILASIFHANTDPPVTKVWLRASFGV